MNKHTNRDVELNVDCEFLTQEIIAKILESILKYILLQCQQIPLQIDILERESTKYFKGNTQESNMQCEPENSNLEKIENSLTNGSSKIELIRDKIAIRKKEIAKRKYESKKKHWMPKVLKFLANYKLALQCLENEMEKSWNTKVLFTLGGSTAIASLAFQVTIEPYQNSPDLIWKNCQVHEPQKKQRRALLQLFRSFSSSAQLSKVMNGSLSTTKLWLLFQKAKSLSHYEPVANLTPKLNFHLPRRTKVIKIVLRGHTRSPYNIIDMELTPCVRINSFPNIYNHRFSTKKRLSLHPQGIFEDANERFSIDAPLDCLPTEDDHEGISDLVSVFRKGKGVQLSNSLLFDRVEDDDDNNYEVQRTSNVPENMIETPIFSRLIATPSPIKRISSGLTDVNFEDRKSESELIWFQMTQPLVGFKDVFL